MLVVVDFQTEGGFSLIDGGKFHLTLWWQVFFRLDGGKFSVSLMVANFI